MRMKQDLSIAVVLAVIGTGLASPSLGRSDGGGLARVEAAMQDRSLAPPEVARVRALIAEARRRQAAADEDGAAAAMAAALDLLGGA